MARGGLADEESPAFSTDPAGALLAAGKLLQGASSVSWTGADRGGGLRTIRLEADGRVVKQMNVAPTGSGCETATVESVPCPLSANGTLDFDTASLPDGVHAMRLVLSDIG